jgi:phosphoribosyl-ATP pyrophosphohydrolase
VDRHRACLERSGIHLQVTTMSADTSPPLHAVDALARLAAVIDSRKPEHGGDASSSYVARLLAKGPDGFLKKIGEEATEVVMAAKDVDHGGDRQKLVNEVADLWFHCMVALAHYGLDARGRDGRAGAPRGHQWHRGERPCARPLTREGEGP